MKRKERKKRERRERKKHGKKKRQEREEIDRKVNQHDERGAIQARKRESRGENFRCAKLIGGGVRAKILQLCTRAQKIMTKWAGQ